jgi:hypothetical protein
MDIGIIVILCAFWIVMAIHEFQRGDMVLAATFVLVGAVLTTMRLRKLLG